MAMVCRMRTVLVLCKTLERSRVWGAPLSSRSISMSGIVRNAEQITALRERRIADVGTHEGLVGRGGLYANVSRPKSRWGKRPEVSDGLLSS